MVGTSNCQYFSIRIFGLDHFSLKPLIEGRKEQLDDKVCININPRLQALHHQIEQYKIDNYIDNFNTLQL